MPRLPHDDDRELLELVDAELNRQEELERAQDRARERADVVDPFTPLKDAQAILELEGYRRVDVEAPDQLAAYRLPDGTIDVDALELGQPTPGYLRAPNYATGRGPEPASGWSVLGPERSPGLLVDALLEWVDGVTLEAEARAGLEASKARRQEGAGGDVYWAIGLALLAALAITALVLVGFGVVRGLT